MPVHKRIGILTSGGDAPGMNAAVRAAVRGCLNFGYEVFGIRNGYAGLLEKDIVQMDNKMVKGIIGRGGTILKTSRSTYFATPEGLDEATDILNGFGIDTLIVVGGDGSLSGALELSKRGIDVVGMPGTIDNDFGASDYTIGFDTAVSTAIDAIAKIRDTTISHNRINIIQVMGRTCGDIALYAGFACGADAIIIPEKQVPLEDICERVVRGKDKNELSSIIILAEGCGSYRDYIQDVQNITGIVTKGTNLGYIQRGGSPSVFDRNLASYMGYKCVEAIKNNNTSTVAVYRDGKYIMVPITEALATKKVFNQEMYDVMQILSYK